MADDSIPASQLRQRYARGGSLADENLTASQLRSRYGIQGNDKNFSTSQGSSGGLSPVLIGVAAIVALVVVYFLFIKA